MVTDLDEFMKTFNPTISIQEAADLLKRHYQTVYGWIQTGDLPTVRVNAGHPRIQLSTLVMFAKQYDERKARK
jgi:excisionase family DNA binding protein